MTKLLLILTTIFFFLPAIAGTFEGGGGPTKDLSIYKPIQEKGSIFSSKREIPIRQLNTVLRNHLQKAKVQQHPSSKIKLFDACINGGNVESISKAPRTHCVDWHETETVISGQAVKKLSCKYWSKSMSFKNAVKYAKRNPNECSLVLGSKHPNQGLYGNRPNEMVPFCNYKKAIHKLPTAQRVEIYNMNEATSNSIYYRDIESEKAQPGAFAYRYTIPICHK